MVYLDRYISTVLHLKFNGTFSTPHFEKPEGLQTGLLVDGMEAGAIVKVRTILIFFVERIDSMDAEFKELVNYGIFKAMKKTVNHSWNTHRRQAHHGTNCRIHD
jgi:hypothetical protein